jgi:hypothetical protein
METKSKKKNSIKVVVLSDMHCGHYAGLTPPQYWVKGSPYYQQQKETWDFYVRSLKEVGHIDYLIHNGDAIDGKGERSGSTELISADRAKQVEIAEECLREAKADKYIINAGTPYHVGKDEDWEKQLAWKLDGEFHAHYLKNLGGLNFDVSHHIGGSSVPHARYTAIARAKLWNSIWAIRGGQPDSNIVIRSHVHFHAYCGGDNWLGMTTPALQGFGSKYGVRNCQGTVDCGFVWFDITDKEHWSWGQKLMGYEVVKGKDGTYESRLRDRDKK